MESRWTLKYLEALASGHGEESGVGCKCQSGHVVPEVEVRNNDLLLIINYQGIDIEVHGNQKFAVGR